MLSSLWSADSDFGRVYETHVWSVYAFFAYRLGDRMLVEDLTQGTFERALRAWPRFDPRRASERTWLLAIARNLLIDHHRRPRPRLMAQLDDLSCGVVDGPEARGALHGRLAAALDELSDREREVLALRFGGDLTASETAEVLELTTANVHQISSRALRRLRAILTYDVPGDAGADATGAGAGERVR